MRLLGRAMGQAANAKACRFLARLYMRIAHAAADEARVFLRSERLWIDDAEVSVRLAFVAQKAERAEADSVSRPTEAELGRAMARATARADRYVNEQLAALEASS